jgi:hypothetical protein
LSFTLSLLLAVFACAPATPDCTPTEERCNGADDDCDTVIDDNAVDPRSYYADADSDGYGDPSSPLLACALRSKLQGAVSAACAGTALCIVDSLI